MKTKLEITSLPAWQKIVAWIKSNESQPPVIITALASPQLINSLKQLDQLAVCQTESNNPCDKCQACRLASQGHHPDVFHVDEAGIIKIKRIRTVLNSLNNTSLAARRLITIHNAHNLSLPAAQALLKSLEEPAINTRYLLLTPFPTKLLPTIRSRAQVFRLKIKPTTAEYSKEKTIINQKKMQRLVNSRVTNLTTDDLEIILSTLDNRLHQNGPSPELSKAFMRLRDYYLVESLKGNTKLAQEVLLASLP
jgi:DNA polymerase III delta prime subunit